VQGVLVSSVVVRAASPTTRAVSAAAAAISAGPSLIPRGVLIRAFYSMLRRADLGEAVDWAELAFDLGYADQAHLTRDFTDTIGVPPAQYAASVSAGVLGGAG
jgi:AraC-like DNA-binding protein